jgi:hypothetical protein
MTVTLRRAAGTAVLALAASALTLPLAAPASAAVPTEKAFIVADRNADGYWGLFTEPTPTGSLTVVTDDLPPHHIYNVSASSDGSRVIYVQINFSTTTGAPTTQQVLVRDMSRQLVRVLETRPVDFRSFLAVPALSPDGNKAVWEVSDDTTGQLYLRKADVASGSPVTLRLGLSPYAFLDNTTVLAQDVDGNPFTLPYTGGTPVATTGLPVEALNVTVSADGQELAFGLFDTNVPDGSPLRSTMNVAPVTLTNGVASVGTATQLASGAYDKAPAFSHDGTTVYWVRTNGTPTGKGDIWSAPSSAGTPAAATAVTAADERDIALTITDDGTPPTGSLVATPDVLNGSSVRLSWTMPLPGPDISGVQLACRDTAHSGDVTGFAPAPLTTYVLTGLIPNHTYDCTYRLADRSNNPGGPGTSRRLVALKAGPTSADPTSNTSVKAWFPVTFGPTSSGFWYVDYLVAGTTTWHPWVTGASGRTRTFGLPATTNVSATTSTPGNNYVFRAQARDSYGNATAYVSSIRAVVPYDQTKATLSGGVNVSTAAAYLGSYRRLSKTTDYAKVTLVGNRLQVVGWKCTTCGAFAIYDGSTLIATVDTRASSTLTHVVLYTRTYSSVGNHTFTIRPKATAGRPYVYLDGFAMRR